MKQYDIKINGKTFAVGIESVNPDMSAKVVVNGKEFLVQISGEDAPAVATVKASSGSPAMQAPSAKEQQSDSLSDGESVITSPLPGVILGINVNVGDQVKAGQCLAVLEAMKMENAIEAERAGVVKKIYVQKGDSILEGAKIIMIG